MTLTKLALYIILPIAIILFIILLIYIIGNVYNGFIKRRSKVSASWHELKKAIIRCYQTLPAVIRNANLTPESRKLLIDVYKTYQSLNIDNDISKLAENDQIFHDFMKTFDSNSISKDSKLAQEAVEFMISERRNLNFSIPLYNSNVSDYEYFRRLKVNRVFAKMFHFDAKQYFMTEEKIKRLKENKELPR